MEKFTFVDRPNNQRIQLMNAVSAADSATATLFLDFQWTYRNMQKVYDDVLDKHDLSESRFIILMFLKNAPNYELLPSVLSEKLGATRATVSKLLTAMTHKGWIVKKSSPSDKRSVPVQLTEDGLQILEQFLPKNFQTVHLLFDNFTEEEMKQFAYLLGKIKKNTDKYTLEMEK